MVGVTVNQALLNGVDQDKPTALPEGVYPEGELIPDDRIELFTVNGRVYTAPKHVNPQVMFRYMRSVRKGHDEEGMATLLYDTLGEAVMDALADEDLAPEEFTQVIKVIEAHVSGAARKVLGN
jgi:hypothetical protein